MFVFCVYFYVNVLFFLSSSILQFLAFLLGVELLLLFSHLQHRLGQWWAPLDKISQTLVPPTLKRNQFSLFIQEHFTTNANDKAAAELQPPLNYCFNKSHVLKYMFVFITLIQVKVYKTAS